MAEPEAVGSILRRSCAGCLSPATVLLISPRRAVQVCDTCRPSAHKWCATTGPVTETRFATRKPDFPVQPPITDEGTLF